MRLTLLAATAALLAALLAVPAGAVDPALLAGLELRSIGPATMSGRVVALDAVSGTPGTLWVGSATGGLWKSTDGGLTFESMFDDQPVASIGAVAVLPGAPETVWVGTGEAFPRNSVSYGDGVYRSLDGGATWEHLGLAESERIARIVLHPADPDTAWVAALGPAWEPGGERGVYRTRDGGATWELVLSGNDTTGAADLAIDPENPRKLFAALWDYRRRPWTFRSGGPGSGLFVSRDGGDSWSRLTPEDGLPEGDLGRIGIAVAPSDPSIVYALVEAEGDENLLLRSADGGRSFERVAGTAEQEIGNRPFYYSRIHVDPADPDRVYSTWSLISVSDDGGKSWEILVPFAQAHPDHHDLWIDPADRDHLVVGNDGGVYVSRDRGASWRFAANLPLAQLYHVRVDDETPYNVYFGLQDNGSWRARRRCGRTAASATTTGRRCSSATASTPCPTPTTPGRGGR